MKKSFLTLLVLLTLIGLPAAAQQGYQPANIKVMTFPLPTKELPKQVKQNFLGYRVMISNMGRTDVTLEKAFVENGHDGPQTYRYTRGKVFSWSSAKSLGISSMRQAHRNWKAKRNAHSVSNHFKKGPLQAGDFKETTTFVPAGQRPRVYVQYRDNRTGKLHEFTR